jgi:hypothetical protein
MGDVGLYADLHISSTRLFEGEPLWTVAHQVEVYRLR